MANLTLYKDFYCISHTSFNDDVYTLITPIELSANTYIRNYTALTENLVIHNESLGKYYVKLNPILYSFDNIYELIWSVVYNLNSPIKRVITRFRLKPYNIIFPVDVEIVDKKFDIEILDEKFDIEISDGAFNVENLNRTLDVESLGGIDIEII